MAINDPGIDYGFGTSNVDRVTGIRYGVISQHDILQSWSDSSEAQYPNPNDCLELVECEDCGKPIDLPDNSNWGDTVECSCGNEVEIEMPDMMEPSCFTYESDGYVCSQGGDDPDIFILKSPYYTYGKFCSPCAPGAVHLGSAVDEKCSWGLLCKHNGDTGCKVEGLPKAYCFGHDWFEDDIAPYRVWRVEDNKELIAETIEVDCGFCDGIGYRSTIKLAEARGEPVPTTEARILSGELMLEKFNPNNHTFECNVCQGSGKRKEVRVTTNNE